MADSEDRQIVKMPRRGGLGLVELVEVHLRPGAWAAKGAPVLSVLADHGRVTLSTTEPGYVLPLLSIGDKVLPGDPLYSLRPAKAQADQDQPDLEGAPEAADRRVHPIWLRSRNWVQKWGWLVLALGAYLAAARWVLPQASGFLPSLSAWSWLGLLVAFIAVGFGGFRLLSRRGGIAGLRFGSTFATAWAILVTGGVYLQAGGVQPLVQPLVQDVVQSSRTVADRIATVALDAIPDVPVLVEAPAPKPLEEQVKEAEAKRRQEIIETGRVVYRVRRPGSEDESSSELPLPALTSPNQ